MIWPGLWLLGAVLVGLAGMGRKIGFVRTFLIALFFSPFVALFVTFGSGLKNARGCAHCGNKENEAEYCGICDMNAAGEKRPA